MTRSDNQARLTDLIMTDSTVLQLYQSLPTKYLSCTAHLKKTLYSWAGELPRRKLLQSDTPVAINAFAYRARHQVTAEIKRIKTGSFSRGTNNINLKIVGVIRDEKLYVVTESAHNRFRDIAARQPARVNGAYQAENYVKKTFSFTKSTSATA